MAQDFGVVYPSDAELPSEGFLRLYQIAENKLIAFMGFVAQADHDTQFVVYSRGTGGGWSEIEYRADWVKHAEGRFPLLEGRITTLPVPGGMPDGSFRQPEAAKIIRTLVQNLLQFNEENPD